MTGPDTSDVPSATPDSSSAPRLARSLRLGVFAASLIVSSGAVGMLHRIRARQVAELEATVRRQERREQELASVKPRFELYRQLIAEVTRRTDTIWGLQNSRVSPEELIKALGKALAMSGGISLATVAGQGRSIMLSGRSRSLDSMASFLTYLERSGDFSGVRLLMFYQDKDQTPVGYKFNLDCVFSPAAPRRSGSPKPIAPKGR